MHRYFMVCMLLLGSSYSGLVSANDDGFSGRFTVHEDGVVLDTLTGLTWQRCSLGARWQAEQGCLGEPELMTLAEAKFAAAQSGDGWRVPSIEELYSLVAPEQVNPAINATVFPDIIDSSEGAPYWSVTPIAELPPLTYYVDFMSGRVDGHSDGFALSVRLVRGE
ncbi:Lcl C-terminal domain-containing protein [Marinomonas fungiae]|uniref:Lcl C-terminal domain-containing protein n=1 Tax=Marinomonas fungiae TaxID=1137284 RepID=A0A0K6IIP6_9GAMM|nr:DUF1566 domain-containing protein [Marinomonas fungiae]CUB02980.1 Protein of unknown function (DUF1566) [Marinomonas fungiae]